MATLTVQSGRFLGVCLSMRCHVISRAASSGVGNFLIERHRKSKLTHNAVDPDPQPLNVAPRDYKFVYPEFLPNPEMSRRDRIAEKLERRDMLRRRSVIDLPEFYVGSIMAVTATDKHAVGKKSRFVGICIQRSGYGLRANFILRNVIDGQGVEINYDMYCPLIQKIEVLRLEKRLDDELFYLRDAPQEYSTFPFDLEAVHHAPGAPIPINTMKVKLGPRPWHERWERKDLRGVEDLGLPQRFYDRAKEVAKPWEKHDLMKQYRESINDPEAEGIMAEVYSGMKDISEKKRSKLLRAQESGLEEE